jgi:hypothetical protein
MPARSPAERSAPRHARIGRHNEACFDFCLTLDFTANRRCSAKGVVIMTDVLVRPSHGLPP